MGLKPGKTLKQVRGHRMLNLWRGESARGKWRGVPELVACSGGRWVILSLTQAQVRVSRSGGTVSTSDKQHTANTGTNQLTGGLQHKAAPMKRRETFPSISHSALFTLTPSFSRLHPMRHRLQTFHSDCNQTCVSRRSSVVLVLP